MSKIYNKNYVFRKAETAYKLKQMGTIYAAFLTERKGSALANTCSKFKYTQLVVTNI
jgi:hypothetical protein